MNNKKTIVADLLKKILRDNIVIEEVNVTNEVIDKYIVDPHNLHEVRFVPSGRSTWIITVVDKSCNKKEMHPQEELTMTENPYLVCEDCGKQDETVEYENCPFMEEIHDEEYTVIVCPDCYSERAMNI